MLAVRPVEIVLADLAAPVLGLGVSLQVRGRVRHVAAGGAGEGVLLGEVLGEAVSQLEILITILALETVTFLKVNLQLFLSFEYIFAIRTRDDVIGLGVL